VMELPEWREWWQREGRDGLNRLLLLQWDPIGLKQAPEAADEYESYASELGRMLRSGSPPEEIARHLAEIESEQMGLEERPPERLLPVAEKLRAWYETATGERVGRPHT
jgi:hypothetical protein